MQKLLAGLISSLVALSIAFGLGTIYYNPIKNNNLTRSVTGLNSFIEDSEPTNELQNSSGLIDYLNGVNDNGSENDEVYSLNEEFFKVFEKPHQEYLKQISIKDNGSIDLVFDKIPLNSRFSRNNCTEYIEDSDRKVAGCFTTNWRFIGEKQKVGVLQIKNYPWEHWWNNYGHRGRLTVYLFSNQTTVIVKGKSDKPIPIEKKEDVEDILRPCFSGNDYDIDNAQRVIEEEGEVSNLESAIFMRDLLLSCPQIKNHYCRIVHHDFEGYCSDTKQFSDELIKQQP